MIRLNTEQQDRFDRLHPELKNLDSGPRHVRLREIGDC